ncbi:MAG: pyridoxine 5'-phosphate synthase, partial [Pirellulaceae bacterium]
IAIEVQPEQATLVPEKREEVTTEGGLDLFGDRKRVERAIERLKENGVRVSLFLDPEPNQIEAAIGLGVEAVELHTGTYALSKGDSQRQQWERLVVAGRLIQEGGLRLHAGHGLNYVNVQPVAAIEGMRELNIGHAIVARAVFMGLHESIREMKRLIDHLPPVQHWF